MRDLSDDQLAKISDSIAGGRKIEAIKRYREATGAGLKEAKEAVERITAELSQDHPEILKAQKSGCASVVVLGLVLGGAVSGILNHWPAH